MNYSRNLNVSYDLLETDVFMTSLTDFASLFMYIRNKNMFSVFLSSYRNTSGSLGEQFHVAVCHFSNRPKKTSTVIT